MVPPAAQQNVLKFTNELMINIFLLNLQNAFEVLRFEVCKVRMEKRICSQALKLCCSPFSEGKACLLKSMEKQDQANL